MMKKKRDYTGVWSNGKKTIDLDNLNSKYEMQSIGNCIYGADTFPECSIYATESGTIIERYEYSEIDDWYCDIGYIKHNAVNSKTIGRNFKKIQDKGVLDEEYVQFLNDFGGNKHENI